MLCAQLVNVFARLVIFCNCLRLLSHCAVFLIYIWVAVWIWFYDLLLMLPGCVPLIVLVFRRWLSPTMMGCTESWIECINLFQFTQYVKINKHWADASRNISISMCVENRARTLIGKSTDIFLNKMDSTLFIFIIRLRKFNNNIFDFLFGPIHIWNLGHFSYISIYEKMLNIVLYLFFWVLVGGRKDEES